MSAPPIIANLSRGWAREPTVIALGTERTGVSAALWRHDKDDLQEVSSEPDTDHHLIGFQLCSFWAETFYDGRLAFSGLHGGMSFNIVSAGVRPRAVIRGAFRSLHIYLPTSLVRSVAAEAAGSSEEVELINPKAAIDTLVARVGEDVLREMRQEQPLSRLRIDSLGLDLAIQLLRRWSNLAGTRALSREPVKGGLAPWQVKRATEYLEGHLTEDVSLEDLARLLDLSTFHLCRAFKQSTGLPPHRWRLQRRILRAREMLEGTDLPVTEIAAAVGYDDPSQLAAAFRKALGVSPSQYRREHRL